MKLEIKCPVCSGPSRPFDVVDFNKSCEELRGRYLLLSGVPVYYFLCGVCGFCFAPEFLQWSLKDFEHRIYNDDYVLIDPDYLSDRPEQNAKVLQSLFGETKGQIRHLDYGGGNGLMSKLLREKQWDSVSYDPFIDREIATVSDLGKFNLITAYEVLEHVPDVQQLLDDLLLLLDERGVLLFTTLLSDNNIKPNERLTWWYASPRNGHISLYSKESLCHLAVRANMNFGSFSENFHALWKTVPPWANQVIQVSAETGEDIG